MPYQMILQTNGKDFQVFVAFVLTLGYDRYITGKTETGFSGTLFLREKGWGVVFVGWE